MPPLVVATLRKRPAEPTFPLNSFALKLPCTVMGKSVWMPPFVVAALTSNSAEAGNLTSTLPLVVASSSSPLHLALPMDTFTPPLVVRAEAHSLVETSTLPLVVAASTTLLRSRQRIPPLVVRAVNRTPRGTWTSKRSLAWWPCHPPDSELTPPWWQ